MTTPHCNMTRNTRTSKPSQSKKRTKRPRKSSHTGSLFTALNLPVFVPLLRLPPEIHNGIWTYALRSDNGIIKVNEEEDFPEPALLRTCKAIRHEAIGLLYSENEFLATVTSCSPNMPVFMSEKMLSLVQTHNCLIQKKLEVHPPRPAEMAQSASVAEIRP